MIVYVESNFVLELALEQEEAVACEGLLRLAESSAIQLAMPAFSLGEPDETLVRRRNERRSLAIKLNDELKQLRRSERYKDAVRKIEPELALLLDASRDQEAGRLNDTLARLLNTAIILPLEAAVMHAAFAAQKDLRLSPQDSIIYASVHRHLLSNGGPKCFINKNSKDFLVPEIKQELAAHQCVLLSKFSAGLASVNARLAQSGT